MLRPTARALRRAGMAATAAALLATASDVALLWVSYAGSALEGIPPQPAGLLLPATYVGALAILVYAVGYWQVACGLLPAGERLARWFFVAGAATGGVGGVIHGMTGVSVRYEALHGGDLSPAHMIALLLPLWVVGVACGAVATALYVAAILRGPTAYPRWMAAANPMVLPLVIAGLSSFAGPVIRALVVPAAPNLAHAIFFALTTAALAQGATKDAARLALAR